MYFSHKTCPPARRCCAARPAVSLLVLSSFVLSPLALSTARAQEADSETSARALTIPATRLNGGIVGASTSIISAEQIERAPEQSIPELIAREAGVQVRSLFGGNSGASATIDIRGFGASAPSNSVILVNGRRINDLDLQGIDFAAIPRDSIERIEIVRGGSAVVPFGEGAIGGVINIVTKSPSGMPSQARVEAGVGSYGGAEGSLSASTSFGDHAVSFYGNTNANAGYRENNRFNQLNGVFTYTQRREWGTVYMNFSADNQSAGLPGARLVDPTKGINLLSSNPRGATTPYDNADKQGVNATLGFTYEISPGVTLITDGGVRQKWQQSSFFGTLVDRASRDPLSYIEASLTTSSLTPRLDVKSELFGRPWKSLSGIDLYRSDYSSPRSLAIGLPAIHQYDLSQSSASIYSMNTFDVSSSTQASAGARVQYTFTDAKDRMNVNAPGWFPWDQQGSPLNTSQPNYGWHLGFEHRLTDNFTLFGRAARSYRVPNVDERIGMSADPANFLPTNFDLKTQTSHDIEAGARARLGIFDARVSVYGMELRNEIHYSTETFSNVNLDPTRRYGAELTVRAQVLENVRVTGNYAFTRAIFTQGVFEGNDVPLVAQHSGSLVLSWDIIPRTLTFDGVLRYVGSRWMDNDQLNEGSKIPAATIFDARLGGQIDKFFWSASVQNLFDVNYIDYAVLNPFLPVRYNGYPLSGRTFMLRAGMKF
ncbi:MAG: TonB-dependent receptor [Beijerinckiaceae bacterium]|nr:TonB-dependent receptor [Beijerinckiaceae bacterium]